MDSSYDTNDDKKIKLSLEGNELTLFQSPPKPDVFCSKSNNPTSLDNERQKKVGQNPASVDGEAPVKGGCVSPRGFYFVCEKGHVVRKDIRCHSRFVAFCPFCGRLWRKSAIKRYGKIVSRMESPKHVVLTLRKRGRHRLDALSRLVHRCRKYVRRKGYRIRSFVFCIEPPNHVHCIWDSDYIPQHEFSEIWRTVTGDSFVVWIERIEKQRWKKGLNYITKYITKIAEHGVKNQLHWVHAIGCWGLGEKRKFRMVCGDCDSFFRKLLDSDYIKHLGSFYFVEVDG